MVVFVSTFFGFIALGVYVGAFSIFNPLFLIYFQHNSLIPYRSSERLTGTVHSLNILFHYHSQNLSMNLAKLQVFASHTTLISGCRPTCKTVWETVLRWLRSVEEATRVKLLSIILRYARILLSTSSPSSLIRDIMNSPSYRSA